MGAGTAGVVDLERSDSSLTETPASRRGVVSPSRRIRIAGLSRLLVVCFAVSLVAASFLITAGSGSASTWGSVSDLSAADQTSSNPRIALSSDGTRATAIWGRSNGTNSIAQSVSGTITGSSVTWGQVTDLSEIGQSAFDQQIALSSDGTRATAIWRRSNGSNWIVQTASATITGNTASWGAITDLSAVGQSAVGTQIALSSDGTRATAVWYRYGLISQTYVTIVQSSSATITGNTASWGAVNDVSQPILNSNQWPANSVSRIALSSDGTRATAVWFDQTGIDDKAHAASAAITGNSASWSAETDISVAGGPARYPEIALSSNGTRATAVWTQASDGSQANVQSASATITGNTASWGSVSVLSAAGHAASGLDIALSSDGTRATAVWFRSDGSKFVVQSTSAAITANTASWGAVTDLSAAGQDALNPQIVLSTDGARGSAPTLVCPDFG